MQIPVERRTSQQTTSLITHGTSALRRATPSHYMVGDPLLRMMQPDPTRIQVSEFAREIHSSLWRSLRKDLDKWTTSRKAALFEAKGTPLEITNWDSMMGTFFARQRSHQSHLPSTTRHSKPFEVKHYSGGEPIHRCSPSWS